MDATWTANFRKFIKDMDEMEQKRAENPRKSVIDDTAFLAGWNHTRICEAIEKFDKEWSVWTLVRSQQHVLDEQATQNLTS